MDVSPSVAFEKDLQVHVVLSIKFCLSLRQPKKLPELPVQLEYIDETPFERVTSNCSHSNASLVDIENRELRRFDRTLIEGISDAAWNRLEPQKKIYKNAL